MRTVEVKIFNIGDTIECISRIPNLIPEDKVVIDSEGNIRIGTVIGETKVFTEDAVALTQKPSSFIIRKLFPFETGDKFIYYKTEKEGYCFCKNNAERLGLEMKLLKVKYTAADNKLIFYYSAEERVDFRELVKILASKFHIRIEMRQINIRDECKILGGIGICGRICCCTSVIGEMNPVTSKITKLQCQNTSKFVGYCGRLLCCLAFDPPTENECRFDEKQSSEKQAESLSASVNSDNSSDFK